MKTQRYKNNTEVVVVLGRIYGRSHLLSSERLTNIPESAGLVKDFLEKEKRKRGTFLSFRMQSAIIVTKAAQ